MPQGGRPGKRTCVAAPRRALVSLIVAAALAIGIEAGLSQANSDTRASATEARTTTQTRAGSSDPTPTLTTEFHFTGERQSGTAPSVATKATVEAWGAMGGSNGSG